MIGRHFQSRCNFCAYTKCLKLPCDQPEQMFGIGWWKLRASMKCALQAPGAAGQHQKGASHSLTPGLVVARKLHSSLCLAQGSQPGYSQAPFANCLPVLAGRTAPLPRLPLGQGGFLQGESPPPRRQPAGSQKFQAMGREGSSLGEWGDGLTPADFYSTPLLTLLAS